MTLYLKFNHAVKLRNPQLPLFLLAIKRSDSLCFDTMCMKLIIFNSTSSFLLFSILESLIESLLLNHENYNIIRVQNSLLSIFSVPIIFSYNF